MSDADLRELGVASRGHRRRLLKSVRDMQPALPAAAPAAAPAARSTPLPNPTAPQYQAERTVRLEGERKQATVLFADIEGSTELFDGMDAEAAHA